MINSDTGLMPKTQALWEVSQDIAHASDAEIRAEWEHYWKVTEAGNIYGYRIPADQFIELIFAEMLARGLQE